MDCTDGLTRRLDETALPREELKLEGPDLPFIAITEPNDARWLKFSLFGAFANLFETFYLCQLKALTSQPDSSSTSKLSVQVTYTGLESCTRAFPRKAKYVKNGLNYPLNFEVANKLQD